MSKRTRKRISAPTSDDPDIGPTPEALHHSEIVYVLPSRFSSDAPVARRVGMHDRLVDSGRITKPQWEWTDRYVRECEVVAGGREGPSGAERVDGDASEPIYDRATAANAFLRRAHDRMKPAQRRLLWDACVMAYRIGDVAIANFGVHPRDGETMTAFGDRIRGMVQRAVIGAIEAGSRIFPVQTVEK